MHHAGLMRDQKRSDETRIPNQTRNQNDETGAILISSLKIETTASGRGRE